MRRSGRVTSDIIVLGGGAAGLFFAFHAARRGWSVEVLERNIETGRKILISGGGRCNFTNTGTTAANFLSRNPHFAKSALARYTPGDFVALVERHGIRYHEKKLGQLFCDGSAREITGMLDRECAGAGVTVRTGCEVRGVESGFRVETSQGVFEAPRLVVATGGLSIPKIGATGLGYEIATQFGLEVIPTRPALVPLTFSEEDRRRWSDLAGVSMDTVVSANGTRFPEKSLFTHRGLSGPAILQISSYWTPEHEIALDLLPGLDLEAILLERRAAGDSATTRSIVAEHLPKRLADRWFELQAELMPVSRAANAEIAALSRGLHCWTLHPASTEGFAKAEVTAGGVSTAELSSKTMEARRVPGLIFIGEVVDVTGWLGGYNFQWAWSSAFAAAECL